ncbi:NADP-dependent oxidoreductase [Janibacter sp. YIM B02568]|uniref:NADP-dependent oxidoreductase n=1 Tax=Janibacter endophyticus TaxID=2806261 RepID=UPI001951A8B8|nr:NADP-dependent oxidoreductase [Janibacter endophyticus]MBM6545050.1 NADP-dependent oxidoreductase [Janibacter endophyticus]
MSLPTRTRHIALAARPQGAPTPADFRLEEVELPELGDGEILVRNTVMSVDPYMRGRMNDVKSYVAPFALDAPLDGGAVGEVLASRSPDVAVGDRVLHGLGWREHAVLPASRVTVVDISSVSDSAYLGVLGMPGVTAYVGLTAVAEMREGDVVFVSGAAGAVGQIAGQVAKALGASRVIGSAGTADKVARVLELGYDDAFVYKDGPVRESLQAAAPEGIDVYFDNVGGEHLEAAISALRLHGRVAMCGAISQYNATEATPGPRNLFQAIGKGLTLRGFIVGQYPDLAAEYRERAAGWLAEGRLTSDETVREGLDAAPQAFIDLLAGANTGKMIVRL